MIEDLKLKKFDPNKMGDNRVSVFIGKRGTGKTTLVTDMLWHKKHLPVGVVMSGTEEGNGHYGQFVPDSFIYSEFDKGVIEKIIRRQKKVSNRTQVDNRVFILLDDLMYDKRINKEKCMRLLYMNGRHWNVCLMVTLQYCMDMPPDLRSNTDYVFVLRENIVEVRKKIWKNFFGVFPTFDMFCQVLDKCTENYECLVLDNTSRSNKIEDCVFWYKADIHPSFRVGAPSFWQYHKMLYKPSGNDDEDESSALHKSEMRRATSKGVTLKVHKVEKDK